MRWPADPDLRRRMVEGLLDWVAGLETEEPAPEGVDPALMGPVPDLFSAVSEIESLRREVGLQGREFRRLTEARREGGEDSREAARREGRREVVGRLLDARDRAARSLATARSVEGRIGGGFPGAGRRRAAFGGLVAALRMNVEALDEALRELDLREVPTAGRPFDPARMRAVEAARPAEGEPGTVTEVLRSGWLLGEEILRFAEVRAVPARPVVKEEEEE